MGIRATAATSLPPANEAVAATEFAAVGIGAAAPLTKAAAETRVAPELIRAVAEEKLLPQLRQAHPPSRHHCQPLLLRRQMQATVAAVFHGAWKSRESRPTGTAVWELAGQVQ